MIANPYTTPSCDQALSQSSDDIGIVFTCWNLILTVIAVLRASDYSERLVSDINEISIRFSEDSFHPAELYSRIMNTSMHFVDLGIYLACCLALSSFTVRPIGMLSRVVFSLLFFMFVTEYVLLCVRRPSLLGCISSTAIIVPVAIIVLPAIFKGVGLHQIVIAWLRPVRKCA